MTNSVVLVEGTSDEVAVRALASRLGRDLDAEGVAVVPIGGAQAIRRVLATLPDASRAVGLCDEREAPGFERALGDACFVCVRDLEDELVRAAGVERVLRVIEERGELSAFRTYQKQVAHRGRPLPEQLHGFMHNRKIEYARLLVDALDLSRVPEPLAGLLASV
ncbi:MAG TPA: TOPRIM nucleotidyl transferase/hydrolase domain-containing protein [Gaiellaceae bacterium]|nr:TOPRIM nucleotidyl transferase/hydrolase domain-containing protein [Gaiellaceae bacterium]